MSTHNGYSVRNCLRSVSKQRLTPRVDFVRRCAHRLESLGDAAMKTEDYGEAAKHYSTARSLNPANLFDILLKRSEARTLMGLWKEALNDADEVRFVPPVTFHGLL